MTCDVESARRPGFGSLAMRAMSVSDRLVCVASGFSEATAGHCDAEAVGHALAVLLVDEH